MDLLIDQSGELVLEGGDLVLTRPGLEDTAQALRVTLETHLGEWQLDTTLGVPWREQVLGKGRDPRVIELVIQRIAEGVPGIIRVERVSAQLDRVTRRLSVRIVALVETPDGDEQLELAAGFDDTGFLTWTNAPLGGF